MNVSSFSLQGPDMQAELSFLQTSSGCQQEMVIIPDILRTPTHSTHLLIIYLSPCNCIKASTNWNKGMKPITCYPCCCMGVLAKVENPPTVRYAEQIPRALLEVNMSATAISNRSACTTYCTYTVWSPVRLPTLSAVLT